VADHASDIISRARAGELAPVYLLVSQQPLLLERALTAIVDAAVPPESRGFNLDSLEGRGLNGSRLLAALQTLPMMAQRRVIVVRDISAVPAAELAKLLPYLDDPNPSTVLVATAGKVDKRVKFYATAKKKKMLFELEPPRRLGPWIREEAAARGVQLGARAGDRLADVVGKDLSRLAIALEQLALYAGDRPVEVDDIDDLIADTRERSVFELTDSIGAGELDRALAAVAALCDQRQSAIGVIVMLARHMRQLGKAQVALHRGARKGELSRELGVPPFIADKIAGQSRRYSARAIGRALERLAEADRALKGYTQVTRTLGRDLGERVILDRVVTELVTLSR
jgi:DNA polymerase-3 subunit delta